MFIGSWCNVGSTARCSLRMRRLREFQPNRFIAALAVAHQCISSIIVEFIDCAQFAWSNYDGIWTIVGITSVKSNGNRISYRVQCKQITPCLLYALPLPKLEMSLWFAFRKCVKMFKSLLLHYWIIRERLTSWRWCSIIIRCLDSMCGSRVIIKRWNDWSWPSPTNKNRFTFTRLIKTKQKPTDFTWLQSNSSWPIQVFSNCLHRYGTTDCQAFVGKVWWDNWLKSPSLVRCFLSTVRFTCLHRIQRRENSWKNLSSNSSFIPPVMQHF